MKTIDYYNKNYKILLKKYDNANVEQLQRIFKKHIQQNDIILDIGFGSGRDLNFIKNITNNSYGLEGSVKFIDNLKDNDFYKNKISHTFLPDINISSLNVNNFDTIISIAVLMHLDINNIMQTIKNMKNILKQNGKVIISYSTKSRDNDERYFFEISKVEMTELFKSIGFKEIEFVVSIDGLNRNIEWITQVYEL